MAVKTARLRDVENSRILNSIRNKGRSNNYTQRIPAATQANIQETFNQIMDDGPIRNEFIDALINQFGTKIAKNNNWANPLKPFKMGMLQGGEAIQEVCLDIAQGYVYDMNRDYLEEALFGRYDTPAKSAYHRVNRQVFYPVTVDEVALRRAFLADGNPDGFGLSEFINSIMQSAINADELDEFKCMVNLFREYEEVDGFWKVHIPDVVSITSGEAESKAALRAIRTAAGNLRFLETRYNAAAMPVHAQGKQLHLFTTPEFLAAINVEALAGMFNVPLADIDAHVTLVPLSDFGDGEIQAVLTTEDFFVVADTYYETKQQANAVGRHTNYYLHHDQILSASPFVPAIAFTTGESSVIIVEESPITGISPITVVDAAGATVTKVERGKNYQLTGASIGGEANAVRYKTYFQSPRSYISPTQVIHPAIDEGADKVTVTFVAVEDNSFQGSVDIPIVGAKAVFWPDPHVDEDADKDGLFEATPVKPKQSADKKKLTIDDTEGVIYKIGANAVSGVVTIAANTTVTASAAPKYELATGATATWDFTI